MFNFERDVLQASSSRIFIVIKRDDGKRQTIHLSARRRPVVGCGDLVVASKRASRPHDNARRIPVSASDDTRCVACVQTNIHFVIDLSIHVASLISEAHHLGRVSTIKRDLAIPIVHIGLVKRELTIRTNAANRHHVVHHLLVLAQNRINKRAAQVRIAIDDRNSVFSAGR